MRLKDKRVDVRLSSDLFRRLEAICSVEKQSKTAIVSDLIRNKFTEKREYILEYGLKK